MNGAGGATGEAELSRKVEEYRARERIYLAGLIEKDAAIHRLKQTANDVKGAYGDVSRAAVRGALVDPTANMEIMALRQKAHEKDREIADLQREIEANRFEQESSAGQVLMGKCRALLEENKELGEQVREERTAELRIAVQAEQQQNAGLQQRCIEAADFCKELTQENDKLLGTLAKVAAKLFEVQAELEPVKKQKMEWKQQRKRERADAKAANAAVVGGGDALMAAAASASTGTGEVAVASDDVEAALFAAVDAKAKDLFAAVDAAVDAAEPDATVVVDDVEPSQPAEEEVQGDKKEKKQKRRKTREAPEA